MLSEARNPLLKIYEKADASTCAAEISISFEGKVLFLDGRRTRVFGGPRLGIILKGCKHG
jgi:hypothetical protein